MPVVTKRPNYQILWMAFFNILLVSPHTLSRKCLVFLLSKLEINYVLHGLSHYPG